LQYNFNEYPIFFAANYVLARLFHADSSIPMAAFSNLVFLPSFCGPVQDGVPMLLRLDLNVKSYLSRTQHILPNTYAAVSHNNNNNNNNRQPYQMLQWYGMVATVWSAKHTAQPLLNNVQTK
jgi:hypothetical protein